MDDAPAGPTPPEAFRDAAGRLLGRLPGRRLGRVPGRLLGACLGTLLAVTATGCGQDPARVSGPALDRTSRGAVTDAGPPAGPLPSSRVPGVSGGRATGGAEAAGPVSADDPVPGPSLASDVLRDWDRARAAAYAHGDVAALRRLYLGRSAAGRADARLLRRYLARGLRVEGMRTQLLELCVLDHGPRRLRLRVVERLVGAEAVHRRTGLRQPLPHAAADERVVELRRTPDGAWRVAGVSG